jgi:hypothetical protein
VRLPEPDSFATDNLAILVENGGSLTLIADTIETGPSGFTLARFDGSGTVRVHAHRIVAANTGFQIGCADCYIRADWIEGIATGNGLFDYSNTFGTASDTLWVEAMVIKTHYLFSIYHNVGKWYFKCEKIWGAIWQGEAGGGASQLFVETQKLAYAAEQLTGGVLVDLTNGESHIRIMKMETNVPAGANAALVRVQAGAHRLDVGDLRVLQGDNGVNVTGGALRLFGRVDTSAQSTKYPLTISGGSVILDRCTLVAHASAASIIGDLAVTALGSYANTAPLVTINGDLTVGSYVA